MCFGSKRVKSASKLTSVLEIVLYMGRRTIIKIWEELFFYLLSDTSKYWKRLLPDILVLLSTFTHIINYQPVSDLLLNILPGSTAVPAANFRVLSGLNLLCFG